MIANLSLSVRQCLHRLSISAPLVYAIILSGSIWLLPFSRSFHLVLLALFAVSLYRIFFDRSCFHWMPATKLWLACNACFALPILFSAFASGEMAKPLQLFALQLCIYFSGFVVLDVVRDKNLLECFHRISLVVLLFWTADLLIQISVGKDLFGFETHARPGIYFSSHFKFGFYYGVLSPLLLFNPHFLRWNIAIKLAVYFTVLAVVLFCNTRSAWLVFGVASLFWFALLLKRGRVTRSQVGALLLGIPLAVALLSFVSSDFHTRLATFLPMLEGISGVQQVIPIRSELWLNLGNMIRENFYFGAGAGNFETAYEKFSDLSAGPEKIYTHSHQVLLELWVGTGFVGAVF